jgi:hypothetical protein
MKRVIELKEIHYETRELQKKARANLLEIDPNAILPELSGSTARFMLRIDLCQFLCATLRFAVLGFKRR